MSAAAARTTLTISSPRWTSCASVRLSALPSALHAFHSATTAESVSPALVRAAASAIRSCARQANCSDALLSRRAFESR